MNENRYEGKRPSEEYLARMRQELLNDPETQREIEEFRTFLESVRAPTEGPE